MQNFSRLVNSQLKPGDLHQGKYSRWSDGRRLLDDRLPQVGRSVLYRFLGGGAINSKTLEVIFDAVGLEVVPKRPAGTIPPEIQAIVDKAVADVLDAIKKADGGKPSAAK